MMRQLVFLILLMAPFAAHAFDCNGPRFRGERPQVNEVHIFCGEIRYGKPDGYHSEAAGPSPVVRGLSQVQPVGNNGVYSARVQYANGRSKFSTFYPRTCSIEQIEASVRYAANHPFPNRGNDWQYGPSAPITEAGGYCTGTNGQPLEIQFARTQQGGINTAFPDGK